MLKPLTLACVQSVNDYGRSGSGNTTDKGSGAKPDQTLTNKQK